MKRNILFIVFLLVFSSVFAQEQLSHKKKWYIDDSGKFYTNKNLPIYIRLSHSPEENAPSHLLKSESMPQYTNPMYLDTEGYNSFRSPSAVDTVTRRVVKPKRDILFEVYADGKSPKTSIKFTNAKKHRGINRKMYYGEGLKIILNSRDVHSGVDKIYYSINGDAYKVYDSEISMDKEGNFIIKYYSVDNVGNVEEVKSSTFSVDLSAPITMHTIQGDNVNNVVSSKSRIFLSAKDSMSGVNKIMYKLNNQEPHVYTKPLPLSGLQEGQIKLTFYAVDNVDNTGDVDYSNPDIKKEYILQLDKSGPSTSAKIIGAQYQGKHLFISENSKIQIDSKDEKSSVSQINYSINSKKKNNVYTEPFILQNKKQGLYYINFSATDELGNVGANDVIVVYVDTKAPVSQITIGQPKFTYDNSTIISQNTNIAINSLDFESDVQKTDCSVDNSSVESSGFKIETEGRHIINYNAIDNVNNVEEEKSLEVIVDNNPPKIFAVHGIESIGLDSKDGKEYPIYPTYTRLFLGASDEISGIKKFTYSINGNKEVDYLQNSYITTNNAFSKEGFYSVKVKVTDKLGNNAEKTVEFFVRNNG